MSQTAPYPWVEIFAAYCKGAQVAELVELFSVPSSVLRARMLRDNWDGLRGEMAMVPTAGPQLPQTVQARMNLIEANRRENYQRAKKLLVTADNLIAKLNEGTLTFPKAFNCKGIIQTIDMPPSSGDLVNVAAFLKSILDAGYTALGDRPETSKSGDPRTPAGPSAPSIVINLPGAIAQPRQDAGQVVDIQADTPNGT